MSLEVVRNLTTIIGVILGAASIVFTALNTSLTMRTSRARFWLDLRDQFAKYDNVHHRLRPGGACSGAKGPASPEE